MFELTQWEKDRIAECRKNHSGQVGHLLAIIDRRTDACMADNAEIERLRLWLRRIDNINDDPSCFSIEIDEAVRAAWYGLPCTGRINSQLPEALPSDAELAARKLMQESDRSLVKRWKARHDRPGGILGEALCRVGCHRWIPYSEMPIADGWMEKCERCGEPHRRVHYG